MIIFIRVQGPTSFTNQLARSRAMRDIKDKVLKLDVSDGDTLKKVMHRIHETEGIPPAQQRYIFAGKPLADPAQTLAFYKIKSDVTLHLVIQYL